ncbi:MAG TPA: TrkA C-terminal domain-containing protein [Acidimicrobiales bacterium]|nr:TrkA C-terminal domain-containing protein [Acidimicrobiales bacterium]
MSSIVLLLVVALVSLLISRVATVALTVTGLPRAVARFQARSALTGAGFTTSESESVVSHPVRRRIVMGLMLLGNVGLATAVAGVLGGFLRADAGAGLSRAALLVAGLAVIYVVSKSERVDRSLSQLIAKLLRAHTELETRDYDRLLHLAGEFSVKETAVEPGSWLDGRTLGELRLHDEGVSVLGIVRPDGSYVPVPSKNTSVGRGDSLVVYGHDDSIAGLGRRPGGPEGDAMHQNRVKALQELQTAEDDRPGS